MKKNVKLFFDTFKKMLKTNEFLFKKNQVKEKLESDIVGELIKYIGYTLSEFVGQDLFNLYGKYAFVNVYYHRQNVYSKIRSPLRKFGDVLSAYQLMAIMFKKNHIEMMKFVTNRDDMTPEQFEKILLFINRDKYPYSDSTN